MVTFHWAKNWHDFLGHDQVWYGRDFYFLSFIIKQVLIQKRNKLQMNIFTILNYSFTKLSGMNCKTKSEFINRQELKQGSAIAGCRT